MHTTWRFTRPAGRLRQVYSLALKMSMKTRLKAIYKRAGLHSKQHLIDAVDALRQAGREKGSS